MEFKTLKNIKKYPSSRFDGSSLLSSSGICACVTIYAIGKSFRFAELQRQKIYVLDQGVAHPFAPRQDATANFPPCRGQEFMCVAFMNCF